MIYLLHRKGWYYYDRRVPKQYAEYDSRRRVRIALNTQCKRTAMKKAFATNDNIENYWQNLYQNKERHSPLKFNRLVMTARQLGFTYRPVNEVASLPLIELVERLLIAKDHINIEPHVKAVLGHEEQQKAIPLSKALKKFWDYSKPTLIKKNPDQQRKWINPRKKAVHNFINVAGDLNINEIANLDVLKLRDWWLNRLDKEDMKASTANKDFTHLKGVIETVCTHEQIDIDVDKIFKKIYFKDEEINTRASFKTNFIQGEILAKKTLKDLDNEARNILYASIETGARPIELVNLTSDDIFLDVPIPYIFIRPRKGYSLKTKESKRRLPLVGHALEAFGNYPDGFSKYRGKSDALSLEINNYLNAKHLRPTPKHSLYSFRHSFQDRLNALEIPDRIQCQLMGHKFKRPLYGEGASLEHLHDLMQRMKIT